PPPQLEERILVAFRHPPPLLRFNLRNERRHGLVKRQADDREHLLARQDGEPMRLEGMGHRRDDHVLAVDQRAVTIEDDEANWRGHASSPSKAFSASRSSKPSSFQLFAICGGSGAST